jgi:hypothetical protein
MGERERYSVHFRVSGPDFDVDALVAAARPAGAHEVWRRGELVGDEGHVARTSGLQIELVDATEEADVPAVIEAFLDAEAPLLTAFARVTTEETHAVVSCALWVSGDEPVSLTLPPVLLTRLAAAGLSFEIAGYPVADS